MGRLRSPCSVPHLEGWGTGVSEAGHGDCPHFVSVLSRWGLVVSRSCLCFFSWCLGVVLLLFCWFLVVFWGSFSEVLVTCWACFGEVSGMCDVLMMSGWSTGTTSTYPQKLEGNLHRYQKMINSKKGRSNWGVGFPDNVSYGKNVN